jgi:alpha-amylase
VEFVETGLLEWISYMVTTYNVDGLRIDTCLEVPIDFWYKFHDKAGVYSTCEAFNSSIELNAEY